MARVYRSMREFEKAFLPSRYQKRLIKEGRFGELARYLEKEGKDLDMKMIPHDMAPKDVGTLLAKICLVNMERFLETR